MWAPVLLGVHHKVVPDEARVSELPDRVSAEPSGASP